MFKLTHSDIPDGTRRVSATTDGGQLSMFQPAVCKIGRVAFSVGVTTIRKEDDDSDEISLEVALPPQGRVDANTRSAGATIKRTKHLSIDSTQIHVSYEYQLQFFCSRLVLSKRRRNCVAFGMIDTCAASTIWVCLM